MCLEIAVEEIEKAEREWRENFNLSYSEELVSLIIEDIVVTDVKHLAFNSHDRARESREKFLTSSLEKVRILRLGHLWNTWKIVLKKQLQLKWNMRHFPSAPPISTTNEQLQSLSPGIRLEGETIIIGNAKLSAKRINDIVQSEFNVKKAVEEAEKRFYNLENRFNSPVLLANFIGSHLVKTSKSKHVYCKILLAHPEADSELTKWLMQKLSIGEVDEKKFNLPKVGFLFKICFVNTDKFNLFSLIEQIIKSLHNGNSK